MSTYTNADESLSSLENRDISILKAFFFSAITKEILMHFNFFLLKIYIVDLVLPK
jgi:hypothetical protein